MIKNHTNMQMKKSVKISIIILIVVLLIIIAAGIAYVVTNNIFESNNNNSNVNNNIEEQFVEEKEDGKKVNISKKFKENKKVEGLDITNIDFVYDDNTKMTFLDAVAENNTDSTTPEMLIRINLLDKEGNVLQYLDGMIQELEPGNTMKLYIGVMADVVNVYDFTIVKK